MTISPSFAFAPQVTIGDRSVGREGRVFVIAEIGPNHNGSLDTAFQMIDAAAKAGCDGVKFQYHLADAEIFDRSVRSYYFNESRYDFIKRVQEFAHDDHRRLRDHAAAAGLGYLCSAFSEEGARKLADLEPDAFKIPSGEVSNPWLLEIVAGAGKPIVASSGMSPIEEIDAMMTTLAAQTPRVVLLHCVSEYPTAVRDMNLRTLPMLAQRYGCPVGLSDHSRRFAEIAASVALGACMVEVHFTFDRKAEGPDHRVSVTPRELAALVRKIRGVEESLGRSGKQLGRHASIMRTSFTNSIVTRRAVVAGEVLSRDNVALKKPGTGLTPSDLPQVLGRRAGRDLAADTPLTWDDLA